VYSGRHAAPVAIFGAVLAPEFVAILRCPRTKEPLIYFPRGERDADEREAFLLAPVGHRRYRIDEGVPVLLAEEAIEVSDKEATRLVERAKALGLDSGAK